MRCVRPMTVWVIIALGTAAPALAQDSGARVSGLFGGSFGDSGSHVATAVSAGYRFTPHVGFEFEVGYLPGVRFDRQRLAFDRSFVDRFPELRSQLEALGLTTHGSMSVGDFGINWEPASSGRQVAFVANFVTEFPTILEWFRPYVVGGGGVASLRTSQIVEIESEMPAMRQSFVPGNAARSETDLVVDIGGGLDFQVWRGLAIAGDVRYFRVFATGGDLNSARVGARASYRF